MAESYVIDLKAVFDKYMASNQKKWAHDRSTTLGASEAFDCMRKLVYEKRGDEFGAEPDEEYVERWGATERGNLIENYFVVPAMAHLPEELSFILGGDDQKTHVLSRNSATPDGLIVGVPNGPVEVRYGDNVFLLPSVTTECIGLEIKSIDPRAVLEEERTKHHNQSQIGIGMIRETTDWEPEYWIILYIDAAWLDVITPFIVTYDPKVFEIAKLRAIKVYELDDPMKAWPEGKVDGGCKYCRWRKACGQGTVNQIAEYKADSSDPLDVAELDPLVVEYNSTQVTAAAAAEEHNLAAQRLKDKLAEKRLKKIGSPGWGVSWYSNKGRKTLDLKAMKADGIDVAKYEIPGAPYDVLRVTDRNK